MITFQIIKLNTETKEVEKIEDFRETKNYKLKGRLLELQRGLCTDGEIPTVSREDTNSDGNVFDTLTAKSSSIYRYLSVIKIKHPIYHLN